MANLADRSQSQPTDQSYADELAKTTSTNTQPVEEAEKEKTKLNFGQLAKQLINYGMDFGTQQNPYLSEEQQDQWAISQPEQQTAEQQEEGQTPPASNIESGANKASQVENYTPEDYWSSLGLGVQSALKPAVKEVSKARQEGESNKDYALRSQGLQDQEIANNYINSGGFDKDRAFTPYQRGQYGEALGQSWSMPTPVASLIPYMQYKSQLENATSDEELQRVEQEWQNNQGISGFSPLDTTWQRDPNWQPPEKSSIAESSNNIFGNTPQDVLSTGFSTIGYDGTPEGDVTAAMAEKMSGTQDTQLPSELQSRLSQSFRDSWNEENDGSYFTTVSSEIWNYFSAEYGNLGVGELPYEGLFDFCMNATPDEFWEFALFAHDNFGMYNGRDFVNDDGTLDYDKFVQFYDECKKTYTIANMTGDSNLARKALGLFITDYQTARDFANYLISSGANIFQEGWSNEDAAKYLWAQSLAEGQYDENYRAPIDLLDDAYMRMGQIAPGENLVGDYSVGGEYSARNRFSKDNQSDPYGLWSYENPNTNETVNWYDTDYDKNYALNNLINNTELFRSLEPDELIDLLVYSQGYGWNKARPYPIRKDNNNA